MSHQPAGAASDETSEARAMASHRNPVLRAHCNRVAALAAEIAGRTALAPRDQQVVRYAGLIHHYPLEFLDRRTLDYLMTDLRAPGWAAVRGSAEFRAYLEELLAVLGAFHSGSTVRTAEKKFILADAVCTANLFAEQIESCSGPENVRESLLRKLRLKVEEGLCGPAILKALLGLPRLRADQVREVVSQLPVFPAVALQVVAMAADEEVAFGRLETLLSSDQVLAGRLISGANSSLYCPAGRISSIRQAISYIGLEATRKLAIAASFHPLFASTGLRDLWRHSLEMARACERLAASSGAIREEEAFLAGLVHDVGRLVITRLPGEPAAAHVRLLEHGCEPVVAEEFLFGSDHGRIGAEVLRLWNFPEMLVEAVECHHRPESSPRELASLLHLAEARIAPVEAPPSEERLRYAGQRGRVAPESLQPGDSEIGVLSSLVAVA